MQSEITTIPYTSIPREIKPEVQNDAEIRKRKRENNVVMNLRDNEQRGKSYIGLEALAHCSQGSIRTSYASIHEKSPSPRGYKFAHNLG